MANADRYPIHLQLRKLVLILKASRSFGRFFLFLFVKIGLLAPGDTHHRDSGHSQEGGQCGHSHAQFPARYEHAADQQQEREDQKKWQDLSSHAINLGIFSN